jgi:rubrerythrin
MLFSYFLVTQYLQQSKKVDEQQKSAPHCKTCGKPMKGHKNNKDCPRNK